jgi:archaeal flagellar protein FlaJ
VLESHKFGGNLTDTFEALSETAVDIDRLKQERLLYLQSQITTGYVIFFVFLGVIIGLEKFLVPTLTGSQPLGGLGGEVNVAGLAEEFRTIFRNLVLIQGLFAGLAVGKMAEGAVIAGVKHSLIMMFVGGIAFAIFG